MAGGDGGEDCAPFERIDRPTAEGARSLLVGGEGRAPLLYGLHANGFNALTYRHLLAPLAAGLRIAIPDQRGHGRSSLRADPARLQSWMPHVRDAIGDLEAMGEGPSLLFGHSMGATVALMVAALRGDLVRALVLADPVVLSPLAYALAGLPFGRRRRLARIPIAQAALKRRAAFASRAAAVEAYRGRGAFRSWPEAVLADYVAGGTLETETGVRLACSPDFEAAGFAAQANGLWGRLARVRAPVHMLLGAVGSTCPAESERRLRVRRPDFRIERVPGTTHFLPMEKPDLVRAAIHVMRDLTAGRELG